MSGHEEVKKGDYTAECKKGGRGCCTAWCSHLWYEFSLLHPGYTGIEKFEDLGQVHRIEVPSFINVSA